MMFSRLVLAILFTSLLISCDNDAPTEPARAAIDSNYFRITALSGDTLYFDESATLSVTDLPPSLDSLRLFIGTTSIPIDVVTSTDLTFLLPRDASTGAIRLYRNGSILAKGHFVITVLPRSIDSIRGIFTGFAPKQGYPGEQIMIGGIDLSMRKQDYRVTIGDLEQPVEYVDSTRMFIRVVSGTQTGALKVKIFDRDAVELGTFEALVAGNGRLMSEGKLTRLSVSGSDITGQTQMIYVYQDDTVRTQFTDAIRLSISSSIIDAPVKIKGDSLIVEFDQKASALDQTIEIRLKVDTTTNMASGVIRYAYRDNYGYGNPTHRSEIHIQHMRWLKTNTSYMLYAYNGDITDAVSSITLDETEPASGKFTRILRYDGGRIGSWLQINLNF